MSGDAHIAVMTEEVLAWLAPEPGKRYLDGTLGLGGHSTALLERTGGEARIVGIDKDKQALSRAEETFSRKGLRSAVHLVQASFADFDRVLERLHWPALDGVVLDLGFSSWQLDDPARGFSFLHDGPLDMRLDQSSQAPSVADLVNKSSFEHLKTVIRDFGQEPMAGRIAKAIVSRREKQPIVGTAELAAIIQQAYPVKRRVQARKHPATKTFQALRIAVNSELEDLEVFLSKIPDYVRSGGKIAVLAFHSLEDRLVKQWFRYHAKDCVCPPEQGYCQCAHKAVLQILTKKPLTPSAAEVQRNSRSRSAKLRVGMRL
mgnify:FL=1